MAKHAGLNTCLPRTRITNFEPTPSTPAATHTPGSCDRSSSDSDNPVIAALRQSRPNPSPRQPTACVPSAAAIVTAACAALAPKSSPKICTASRVDSTAICGPRPSRRVEVGSTAD